jgi:isopenicillin N synthase-like dioxygenase
MSSSPPVPVIDWPSGAELPRKGREALDRACRESGFFYLRIEGLEDRVRDVWEQLRWFFALPVEVKRSVARSEDNSRGYYDRELTKNARDMKEVFDFGSLERPDLPDDHPDNRTQDGWNLWPSIDGGEQFRKVLQDWFADCHANGLHLLAHLAQNLGAHPDTLTQDFSPHHSSFLRLNYYPLRDPLAGSGRADATGHMGVHHHTDAGAVTLLLQDKVGGLQIHHDGVWLDVPPIPGTLVINIGDIVQVWSNDRYRAPLHRVIASSRQDRYSIPFFLNPVYSAQYAPLAAQTGAGRPPMYRPINWGEFRFQRQHGDYGDYGHEVQIADFRTG